MAHISKNKYPGLRSSFVEFLYPLSSSEFSSFLNLYAFGIAIPLLFLKKTQENEAKS